LVFFLLVMSGVEEIKRLGMAHMIVRQSFVTAFWTCCLNLDFLLVFSSQSHCTFFFLSSPQGQESRRSVPLREVSTKVMLGTR
jgi:hypothetical protein